MELLRLSSDNALVTCLGLSLRIFEWRNFVDSHSIMVGMVLTLNLVFLLDLYRCLAVRVCASFP